VVGITFVYLCSLRLFNRKKRLSFDVILKTGIVLSLFLGLATTNSFAAANSDSNFTTYLYRLEAVRDQALTYAYYLRSAYLRERVNHLLSSGRICKRARNDIFESVCMLEKTLEYSPDSIALWLEYANINGQLGRIDKVIQSYEQIVKIAPSTLFCQQLGNFYELYDMPELAVKQYEQAFKLSPDDIFLKERIVDVYIEQGFKNARNADYELSKTQFVTARKKLKELINYRNKARYLLKYGLLCELLGEPDKALKEYKKVISLDPDETDAYIRASRIYSAMGEKNLRDGKTESAKQKYKTASELMLKVVPARKSKTELLNFTAYILALSGEKLDFAEKLVKEALKDNNENSAYIDTLGWILFKKGNVNAALKKMIHANQLTSDDPVLTDHLGDIYYKLGQPEKAKEMWEKSLSIDANNISVKNKLNKLR